MTMPGSCKWCHGRGYLTVEPNSSLSYACTDCDGTGMEQPEEEECVVCGQMVEVDEDCDCCEECGGSGRLVVDKVIGPCPACIKHGRIDE